MTGSMYAAVSGLKSHMNALNVIGNNVSNVNTTAYKATRYTFNEALYTTQRTGSDGTQVSGGRNPAQVGFGASIGTIDLDMSTKNYTPTGQLLDTMIDGDGFFFVGDKELGDGATALSTTDETALAGMKLTRLGNFNIDPNGYLVDGNGSVVWGFLETDTELSYTADQATKKYTTNTAKLEDRKYDLTTGEEKASTTEESATVKSIKNMTKDEIEKLQKFGVNLHNVQFETITQTQIDNLQATEDGKLTDFEKNLKNRTKSDAAASIKLVAGDQYFVSATITNTAAMGAIRLPMKNEGNQIVWSRYSPKRDATYLTDQQSGAQTLVETAEPAKFLDDESKGSARLQADSVSIDEKSGALRVMTSDGTLYTVGYIALGKVTNPNGVTHVDGRYYQAQDGAGKIRVTTVKGALTGPESAGDTALITGGLESSGTDLATEITNMITVQRGYQANTRIVTVTDSMLEELVNMKR